MKKRKQVCSHQIPKAMQLKYAFIQAQRPSSKRARTQANQSRINQDSSSNKSQSPQQPSHKGHNGADSSTAGSTSRDNRRGSHRRRRGTRLDGNNRSRWGERSLRVVGRGHRDNISRVDGVDGGLALGDGDGDAVLLGDGLGDDGGDGLDVGDDGGVGVCLGYVDGLALGDGRVDGFGAGDLGKWLVVGTWEDGMDSIQTYRLVDFGRLVLGRHRGRVDDLGLGDLGVDG